MGPTLPDRPCAASARWDTGRDFQRGTEGTGIWGTAPHTQYGANIHILRTGDKIPGIDIYVNASMPDSIQA